MLKTVDRILVAVNDLAEAEANYVDILGATAIGDFQSTYLKANIRRMAIGTSEVELCCPTGPGPVMQRLQTRGEGLIFGGVTTDDLGSLRQLFNEKGLAYVEADSRIYPSTDALYGLPLAISQRSVATLPPAKGPVDFLYELTMALKTDWDIVAQRYSDLLGLNRSYEVDITFARFGYTGTLMKFQPDHLDRIELAEAHDTAFPMGRFTAKHGDGLYMCYIETNDLADIIARLEKHGRSWTRRTTTTIERDGLWIHPSALNGVLLGVSRSTLAWGWSGNPERVRALPCT